MEINWLLICVAAVIAVCVYHGYRSGLVRILFSIATFIVTIVIVRFLAPVGTRMLQNNDMVYNSIRESVEKVLDDKKEEAAGGDADSASLSQEMLEAFPLSEDVKEEIFQAAKELNMDSLDIFAPELKSITADYITLKIIDLLVHILLFFIINIGLRVAGILLNHFSKLPGINGVNKAAGSAFGVIEGVAFVWIFFIVITIFSTTEWGLWCFQKIESSAVLTFLYAKNVFLIFMIK